MRLVLSALLMVAFTIPAAALETVWHEAEARPVHHKPKCKRRHHRPAPVHEIVRKVVLPPKPDNMGAECVERRIDVISTPHQTINDAKDAAQTQWRAKTQFMVGGVYMDPSLSEDQKWLCSITDPRDAASGKVSETAGRLLGKDGELYRCYFSARPCRSNLEVGDDTDDPSSR